MNIVSSYGVEIKKQDMFDSTIKIYREAVSFLIECFDKEWESLSSTAEGGKHSRFNRAEKLVHTTNKNKAKYDFDAKFCKFPSYLRRAAVQAALGAVSSYRGNLKNWEKKQKEQAESEKRSGKKRKKAKQDKKPRLQCDRFCYPAFYRGAMYTESETPNKCYLKMYANNDWVWVPVSMRATDVKYITKYWSHCKKSAPVLEKKYRKYFLRFSFEETVELSNTPVQAQRVCAVDLGLNTDAVCSIMAADGTVLKRKFINFPSEKDQLYHVLNRIKRKQREHGPKSVTSLWGYAKRLNDELAKKVSAAIVAFAKESEVDVIVFEYLDFRDKKHRGSKAQRLSLWKRSSIQDYAEHKAHRNGIRISRICAWRTSRLAFDGSGELKRDPSNHELATFANDKRYNCDLSASYNIGARYFVRELLNPLPVRVRSQLEAKVPSSGRRTSTVLATLRALYPEYEKAIRELDQAA